MNIEDAIVEITPEFPEPLLSKLIEYIYHKATTKLNTIGGLKPEI